MFCFLIHFYLTCNTLVQAIIWKVRRPGACNCLPFVFIHITFSIHLLSGLPVITKVPPSPATPIQRSTFQAVCQAEGFPRPVISWRRVGMPFPGGRTELNNGTLTIKNLILADSGLYDCIATNAMGTKKTRINVVVQRKPGKLYIFNTKSSRVLLMNLRC